MYFDSHIHIGNFSVKISEENKDLLGYIEYSKNTPENCIKKAIANSVVKAVVFPFPLREYSFQKQNDYVLSAAKKYPYFFVPFLLPESPASLDKKKDFFFGIKDHFYLDLLDCRERNDVIDFAQSEHKKYIFHAHWKKWEEKIIYLCQNFPKLEIIVAHSARISPFLGDDLSSRLKNIKELIPTKYQENFYFETSTIRNSKSIEDLVNIFGPTHILWGSDYPYYSVRGENVFSEEINTICSANISDKDKELILRENFRTFYQNDEIWVRKALPQDSFQLFDIIDTIIPQEQKFLALHLKKPLIRSLIKKGQHLLIAENMSSKIVGFLRSSDRRNNGVMVEEVYVCPEFRGKGIASKLINSICASYESVEVKTFASNSAMIHTLEKMDFIPKYSPKGTMILWTK
ncbi:MAG: GNAT family N-acetyltransferase [Thermoguttaceae bacterium]|nr:GNAT family N-acetyltransferase [Thermoguttaceae bacterium]